ncbi:LacI family DNA-binding transcriptional regulator [Geminisphaera colitermitum]|uniref:LacI family DNA-binding transcriptional regulator n=1 Tax=Geminisphaera colitermitum TaxID=1148786 RepID=UPI00019652E7|nr:LacI family DNA-binding transcriptional regulator [Geminisphaera colitermitum]
MSSPIPPPTLRQVAAAAGVHHTTLSRALRGHPDVSKAKAEELRALAAQMGYVPDPMLRALAAYRTGRRPAAFHSVIAWLNPSMTRSDWKGVRTYRLYFESAARRARELGFQLEEVTLPSTDAKMVRVTSMLNARNITGVIVGPVPRLEVTLEAIDWSPFSAVRVGESVKVPRLHAITAHHSQGMLTLMQELRMRGYQRPGLFLSKHMDERTGRRWTGSFLREQLQLPAKNRVPPRLFENVMADMGELTAWLQKNSPDVLIAMGERALLPTLRRQCGWRVPEDIGLAVLVQPPEEGLLMSGLAENNMEVGAASVDFLVAMLNRQERGVPRFPQTLQIDNQWVDGGTLREQVR